MYTLLHQHPFIVSCDVFSWCWHFALSSGIYHSSVPLAQWSWSSCMGLSWRFSDVYRHSPMASVLCLLDFFALFATSTWLFITVTLFYCCLLFIVVHTLLHGKPWKLSWCTQYPLAGKAKSFCFFTSLLIKILVSFMRMAFAAAFRISVASLKSIWIALTPLLFLFLLVFKRSQQDCRFALTLVLPERP